MAFSLFDAFLRRLVRRGELTVIYADGRRASFGAPDPVIAPVTLRFADAGVTGAILRNPSLGAGECYMNGRLLIDQGDVLDLSC